MTRPLYTLGGSLLLGVALLAAPAAQAQPSPELTMEIYNSNVQVITSGIINKNMLDNAIKRHNGGAGTSKTASSGTAAARPTASTAYTPTPALRRQTVQGYVDRLKPSNPAGAQAINATFGPGKYDYGQVYRGIVDGTGLRENDAADAMAAYLILGWMIVHNVQDGKAITPAMARGVRAQVAPLVAANPQARSHVAQVGEEMKLQAVLVQGGWQAALKESKLPAYQQGIGSLFKNQYGMNLSAVKLTSQGFVPQ